MIINGFRASHRNRWLFVSEGVLTVPEMVLLDFYIDKMNFSAKSEDVGTFDLDFAELEIYLDRKEKTIRALNKNLLEKGFIKWINPNKYAVTHWERYILDKKDKTGGLAFKFQKQEYNLPIKSLIQNLGINFQIAGKQHEDLSEVSTPDSPLIKKLIKKNNINIQNSETEEKKITEIISNTLDTSKDEDKRKKNIAGQFPKWVLIQQEPRTDKEYQKLQDEQSDEMKMPIEDMKWIDQNAHEFMKIEDEEEENWVMSLYFGGDRARYEKYLDPNQTSVTICL